MGLIILTKICLLILLISASLISTSSAGRCGSTLVMTNLEETRATDNIQEVKTEEKEGREEIHERLLRANTKDYGRYDPAPALVKPPFKLIPN